MISWIFKGLDSRIRNYLCNKPDMHRTNTDSLAALRRAIFKAIDERRIRLAVSLLEALYAEHAYLGEAAKMNVDEMGHTFLHYAIQQNQNEIFCRFLDQQKDCRAVIFNKNHQNITLIMAAVANAMKTTNYEMLRMIFFITREWVSKKGDDYKAWLEVDNDGNNVFHQAILKADENMIRYLINAVDDDATVMLNHKNKEGLTPLWLALSSGKNNIKILQLLMNNGGLLDDKDNVCLSLINNNFLKLPATNQIELLWNISDTSSNEVNKIIILQQMKNHLLVNPESENIKKAYFTISGSHSLLSLLYAHHEFNPSIPVRECYEMGDETKSILDGDNKHLNEGMPTYFNNVSLLAARRVLMSKKDLFYAEHETRDKQNIIKEEIEYINGLINQIEEIKKEVLKEKINKSCIGVGSTVTLMLFILSASLATYSSLQVNDNWLSNYQPTRFNSKQADQNCSLAVNHNKIVQDCALFFGCSERFICIDQNASARFWYGALSFFAILSAIAIIGGGALVTKNCVTTLGKKLDPELYQSLIKTLEHLVLHGELIAFYASYFQNLKLYIEALRSSSTKEEANVALDNIKDTLKELSEKMKSSEISKTFKLPILRPLLLPIPRNEEVSILINQRYSTEKDPVDDQQDSIPLMDKVDVKKFKL